MQLTAMIVNSIYRLLPYWGSDDVTFYVFRVQDTSDQLAKDNGAVGLAVMGIFIGAGVAIGLVIGLGLN